MPPALLGVFGPRSAVQRCRCGDGSAVAPGARYTGASAGIRRGGTVKGGDRDPSVSRIPPGTMLVSLSGGIWSSGACDRDLSSKSIVDHDGAFEETSPEKDSVYLVSRREFDAGESSVLVQLQAWDRYACCVDVVDPVSPDSAYLHRVYGGELQRLRQLGVDATESGSGVDQRERRLRRRNALNMGNVRDGDMNARAEPEEPTAVCSAAVVKEAGFNKGHRRAGTRRRPA